MKKIVVTLLLIAILTLTVSQVTAEDTAPVKIGTLSMLNLTEEQYAAITESRLLAYNYLMNQGVVIKSKKILPGSRNNESLIEQMLTTESGSGQQILPSFEIEYYDTLDTMIMALQSGSVQYIFLPQSTAEYLCSNNDALQMPFTVDYVKAADRLAYQDLIRRSGSGYSFMMPENQKELWNLFNETIDAMVQDGTLETLQQKYISDVISGGEIDTIAFEKFDGAPIRVAVTGSLPTMDYIAPDGSFAGFNTALLSEIGKRLERNIELVQVDSVGRAAALSSGIADVVFWTQTTPFSWMTTEERMANAAERAVERAENYTEEEQALWQEITEKRGISREEDANQDMPKGTIATKQYFQDATIFVMMKGE